MAKFDPCPQCKGNDIVLSRKIEPHTTTYQVRCLSCDCRAGKTISITAAEVLWQKMCGEVISLKDIFAEDELVLV